MRGSESWRREEQQGEKATSTEDLADIGPEGEVWVRFLFLAASRARWCVGLLMIRHESVAGVPGLDGLLNQGGKVVDMIRRKF